MKNHLRYSALLGLMALLLLAVSNRVAAVRSDTPTVAPAFKLGALLCLTGDCAEWGANSLMGMQLAAEEINASGGVLGRKIEIVSQDTKEASSGSNAVSAYRQLMLDSELRYIVGPSWTVGGLPLAPIAAKNPNVLVTSPSLGVAKFNETGKNIFNVWPHDSFATEGLAQFAIARGFKRVAILSGNDAWVTTQGDTFAAAFKRLGGEVTIQIEVNPGSQDLRSEALKINQTKPDAVFYADTFSMSKVARALANLRFTGAQLSILMDDTRVSEAQGALENTYFAMYPEASAEFQTRFAKRFGKKPGITTDTAYDTVKLYAAAITQANSFDPRIVGPIMHAMKLQGASGQIVFDQQGGVKRSPNFYQVKGGKFTSVK